MDTEAAESHRRGDGSHALSLGIRTRDQVADCDPGELNGGEGQNRHGLAPVGCHDLLEPMLHIHGDTSGHNGGSGVGSRGGVRGVDVGADLTAEGLSDGGAADHDGDFCREYRQLRQP